MHEIHIIFAFIALADIILIVFVVEMLKIQRKLDKTIDEYLWYAPQIKYYWSLKMKRIEVKL